MIQLTASIPITVEYICRRSWEVLSRETFANAIDFVLHRSQSVVQEAPHTWDQIQEILWKWLEARDPRPDTVLANMNALRAVDTLCTIVDEKGEADCALEAAMDELTAEQPVLAVYRWHDSRAWIVGNVYSSLRRFTDEELLRLMTASPTHFEQILAMYRGWLRAGNADPNILLTELAGLGITDRYASLLAPVATTDVHRAAVAVYPADEREDRVRVVALEIAGFSAMMMETTTLDPAIILACAETRVINQFHFQEANHHPAGSLE